MEFRTKYGIGDTLWAVVLEHKQNHKKCPICKGTGTISISEETFSCPKCLMRSGMIATTLDEHWSVMFCGSVGLVRAECREASDWDDEDDKEVAKTIQKHEYMCSLSGVGSGSVWREERLFTTKGEAQAVCDKKNAEKDSEEQK